LVKLFEDAFKQQPDNDEFGRQAFFANVRAGNWKAAQLVRFPLHATPRARRSFLQNSAFPAFLTL
jgi:N-terminal acetyltransferase B complex non-catalytic subunit